MKHRHAYWLGAACLLWPVSLPAAWLGFLQLPGVPGESTNVHHPGWMEVSFFDRRTTRPDTNAAAASPLCFLKTTDGVSPLLSLACAEHTRFSRATLDLTERTNTLVRFLRLNLTNVFVTAVSLAGTPGSAPPAESVCLDAAVHAWDYIAYRMDSGLTESHALSQWDFPKQLGGGTNSPPLTLVAGVRRLPGDVELTWPAVAGRSYRVFAVPSLNARFLPVWETNVPFTGTITQSLVSPGPTGFFVVEQLP